MEQVSYRLENNTPVIVLSGRIDSSNVPAVEAEINRLLADAPKSALILDCKNLAYISSAGLRVVLRLKKAYKDLKLVDVSSEVYEIFDVTGFTEMMDIQKAYRFISIEGKEVVGEGANGKVYRIDPDTIVKVYRHPDALPEIQRERELAHIAFVLGIPTAIPYDVVRVDGNLFGSVFELLNAKSFAKLLIKNERPLEEVVQMSVELLKQIHETEVKPDSMPDMKKTAQSWVKFLVDYLPADTAQKLTALVDAVPTSYTMLHGDYHIKNIMLQNDEILLIDMDTLCYGNPVFEFGSIFNAYQGFSAIDHENVHRFLGIPYDTASAFWDKTVRLYFDGAAEEEIALYKEKAELMGFVRTMRRLIRRNGLNEPEGRAFIEYAKNRIIEIVNKIDSLAF